VRFRPTLTQVVGRGVTFGGGIGVAVLGALALVGALGVLDWTGLAARLHVPAWLALVAPLVAGPAGGGALAVLFGREVGAEVDDVGIHTIPRAAGGDAPWHRIEDLRAERRGGRTHVAVYLDSGQILRLPAPYDGAFGGRDQQFERKLFMLRHLWETHRSFVLPNQPLDGP
jgi:hypothetical protein